MLGKAVSHHYPATECFITATWNELENRYHWYVTNMDIEPKLSYPIYRLRWQIELFFKSAKSYLNVGRITTANPTIILNLVMISLISFLITMPLVGLMIGQDAYKASILRIGIFIQKISSVMIGVLLGCSQSLIDLKRAFDLWRDQLFEPNYAKRQSSIIKFSSILSNA